MWNLDCRQRANPGSTGQRKVSRQLPGAGMRKKFEFEPGEAQVFDLPLLLFERRHFYRSELL
jgi:hypothetical protein